MRECSFGYGSLSSSVTLVFLGKTQYVCLFPLSFFFCFILSLFCLDCLSALCCFGLVTVVDTEAVGVAEAITLLLDQYVL